MNIILPSQYKRTRISLLLISLLSLYVATANAQDITQEPAEQTAEEKTQKILEQAYKNGLEVIEVTSQKRIQNLQEVPVSVSAFSGEQMAESVIKDMYDLQNNVPGLGAFQAQSSTNSNFSIRGVGTSSQNFGVNTPLKYQ